MQTNIKELLNNVFKQSESFQDETNLINIPWVLIEEEPAARKMYILRSQQELMIYVDDELSQIGKWMVSKTTKYFSVEIDKELTLFERGFLNDTYMLLEKEDGTYRLFVNEEELKDKERLPSFRHCLALIEQKTLVRKEFNERGCVLAIGIIFLIIGLFFLFFPISSTNLHVSFVCRPCSSPSRAMALTPITSTPPI